MSVAVDVFKLSLRVRGITDLTERENIFGTSEPPHISPKVQGELFNGTECTIGLAQY